MVYHLLGRSSSGADHVATDEDLLEFLNALHGETQRPELLFDALKHGHLLLIGMDLPDWAFRLLLRLVRGGCLSGQRDGSEYLVAAEDIDDLALFLKQVSKDTTIIDGDHRRFVAAPPGDEPGRRPVKVGSTCSTRVARKAQDYYNEHKPADDDWQNLRKLGNLADAELFLGHRDAALALYGRYKGQTLSDGQAWETAVRDDFAALKKAGLTSPSMAGVRRLRGVAAQAPKPR